MSNPLVACILLTADRPEMTARAVRCFEAQTYKRKKLLVYDTGVEAYGCGDVHAFIPEASKYGATIGFSRNRANRMAAEEWPPDMFAHFDSDDWSHPNRLAEQVALIESDPQLDAVGYTDMLFWRTPPRNSDGDELERFPASLTGWRPSGNKAQDEAWLYSVTGSSSYLLGTSLLYRRAAWERKPFEDTSYGEDRRWLAGPRTKGVSSFPPRERIETTSPFTPTGVREWIIDPNVFNYPPRMIASIHGGNASSRIDPEAENWNRVPEWDAHCRATMALPVPVSR